MAKQRTSGLPLLSLVDRLSLRDDTPADQLVAALTRGLGLICRYCGLEEHIPAEGGETPYQTAEEKGWELVDTAQGQKAVCPRCARTHVDQVHHWNLVKQYTDSLKRDLEWLFNTRRTFDPRMDDYPQSKSSVYAYGIADITSVNVGSTKAQSELLDIMKESLRLFEPRLKNVAIEFQPVVGGGKFLRFIISAVLHISNAPEVIHIETTLDSSNASYKVPRNAR